MVHLRLCARNNTDWRLTFELSEVDPATRRAAPRDLTGAAFRMQLRGAAGDAVAALDASTADGTIVPDTDPTRGLFYLAIPADVVANLPGGRYVADLVMVQNGETLPIFDAVIEVAQGITRTD